MLQDELHYSYVQSPNPNLIQIEMFALANTAKALISFEETFGRSK